MPKPQFTVKHFVACGSVSWYGGAGPQPPYTLEELGFEFLFEPDAEEPFGLPELWLYIRFFYKNNAIGKRRFTIRIYRMESDGRESLLHVEKSFSVAVRSPANSCYERVWLIRNVQFPASGDYAIRLLCHYRKWSVRSTRTAATEFIRIRRKP